ncbi:MAG TPA: helix-turn-helix domain-containing protein [Candidatus Acidoferrum sp.]|nr:helix-turn-helix domain-containing protein [Candidatus Acidoferrum sp.]
MGKTVSQEEVAEAVGITRQWYGMLESDRAASVSASVLARIADALMMDPVERSALFRLAVPELRSTSLADRSTATLEAFDSLRRLTQLLWAATSVAEVLAVVCAYAMTQFTPDAVITCTRVGEGRWEYAGTGDCYDGVRLRSYEALIRERWGAATVDDLQCFTLLAQPGEVITRSERDERFPDLAAKRRSALDAMGWSDVSFAMANIRTQHGFVARLAVVHATDHTYSEMEREQLSTLADLTSLALSAYVSPEPG